MTLQLRRAISFVLNDYRFLVTDKGVHVEGPDPVVISELRHNLGKVIAQDEVYKAMSALAAAANDHLMEQAEAYLIPLLGVPARGRSAVAPATDTQKRVAKHFGIRFADTISQAELAGRIQDFVKVRTYVQLVWQTMTRRSLQDCDVTPGEVNALCALLVQRQELCHRIVHARLRWKPRDTDQLNTILEHLDSGRSSLADIPNSIVLDKNDPLYLETEAIVRQAFKKHLPGFLTSLLRRMWASGFLTQSAGK